MSRSPLGPYQLQVAINAIHAGAATVVDTDWREVEVLYRILGRISATPMVPLNRAIAVAMTPGREHRCSPAARHRADR
jgi:predicted RNA polymerase sigma factor